MCVSEAIASHVRALLHAGSDMCGGDSHSSAGIWEQVVLRACVRVCACASWSDSCCCAIRARPAFLHAIMPH